MASNASDEAVEEGPTTVPDSIFKCYHGKITGAECYKEIFQESVVDEGFGSEVASDDEHTGNEEEDGDSNEAEGEAEAGANMDVVDLSNDVDLLDTSKLEKINSSQYPSPGEVPYHGFDPGNDDTINLEGKARAVFVVDHNKTPYILAKSMFPTPLFLSPEKQAQMLLEAEAQMLLEAGNEDNPNEDTLKTNCISLGRKRLLEDFIESVEKAFGIQLYKTSSKENYAGYPDVRKRVNYPNWTYVGASIYRLMCKTCWEKGKTHPLFTLCFPSLDNNDAGNIKKEDVSETEDDKIVKPPAKRKAAAMKESGKAAREASKQSAQLPLGKSSAAKSTSSIASSASGRSARHTGAAPSYNELSDDEEEFMDEDDDDEDKKPAATPSKSGRGLHDKKKQKKKAAKSTSSIASSAPAKVKKTKRVFDKWTAEEILDKVCMEVTSVFYPHKTCTERVSGSSSMESFMYSKQGFTLFDVDNDFIFGDVYEKLLDKIYAHRILPDGKSKGFQFPVPILDKSVDKEIAKKVVEQIGKQYPDTDADSMKSKKVLQPGLESVKKFLANEGVKMEKGTVSETNNYWANLLCEYQAHINFGLPWFDDTDRSYGLLPNQEVEREDHKKAMARLGYLLCTKLQMEDDFSPFLFDEEKLEDYIRGRRMDDPPLHKPNPTHHLFFFEASMVCGGNETRIYGEDLVHQRLHTDGEGEKKLSRIAELQGRVLPGSVSVYQGREVCQKRSMYFGAPRDSSIVDIHKGKGVVFAANAPHGGATNRGKDRGHFPTLHIHFDSKYVTRKQGYFRTDTAAYVPDAHLKFCSDKIQFHLMKKKTEKFKSFMRFVAAKVPEMAQRKFFLQQELKKAVGDDKKSKIQHDINEIQQLQETLKVHSQVQPQLKVLAENAWKACKNRKTDPNYEEKDLLDVGATGATGAHSQEDDKVEEAQGAEEQESSGASAAHSQEVEEAQDAEEQESSGATGAHSQADDKVEEAQGAEEQESSSANKGNN